MLIYVAEATIITWISISWLTIQSALFSVSPLDAVVFYTQALFSFVLLVILAVLSDTDTRKQLVKSLFILNLSVFIMYTHAIDQALNYNVIPEPSVKTCTNAPHSRSFRDLFLSPNSPFEVVMAYSATTLSFVLLQVLLTAGATLSCTDLWDDSYWCEGGFFFISLLHIYMSAYDAWSMYNILLIIFSLFPVFFLAAFLAIHIFLAWKATSTKKEDYYLFAILQSVRTLLVILWGAFLYIYLCIHTHSLLQWSFLPLFILIAIVLITESVNHFQVALSQATVATYMHNTQSHDQVSLAIPNVFRSTRPLSSTKKQW